MIPFLSFGTSLLNIPYHTTADAYGRKHCARMNSKRGHTAKLKAKNRKKRKMRSK